jgi:protein phosphatase
MNITIPDLSLVVLIGPSGSGKSTFARKHFLSTEVLSSDWCRGLVADDENDQGATVDAFEVLHFIAAKRLAAGRLTVVDATNVQPDSRKPSVALARQYHCLPVALVFNLPEKVCHERNAGRPDRSFGGHVIRQQHTQMRRALRGLKREGFSHVYVLNSPQEVETAVIERQPLWNNRKGEHGPFDIIGDVHGCFDELVELLRQLGYQWCGMGLQPLASGLRQGKEGDRLEAGLTPDDRQDAGPTPAGLTLDDRQDAGPTGDAGATVNAGTTSDHRLEAGGTWVHPDGRKVIFLGDLVDRGPRIPDVLRLAMNMVAAGSAICVPGNHDMKLLRKLRGRDVQITHGLAESVTQLESEPPEFREQVAAFIDEMVSHYVFDDGKLVVAHAGMKASMQGRGSGKVREFALYGETTGETDEFGLPVRYPWANDYRGGAMVVYGHTPVPEPQWLNRTINIDTGCVFGGKLTALRYPERELVSVPAARVYCEPSKPFLVEPMATSSPGPLSVQQEHDDVLDFDDVCGKRIVQTRLHHSVTIREGNAMAALEVMSRFAANPKWLVYLPPTMSPSETSHEPNLLEHPAEAFAHFFGQGVPRVICEQKHMGSRAVVIVCRDEDAARKRFGVMNEGIGIVYTRTGRRFFNEPQLEAAFLDRVRQALDRAGFWEEFTTDWFCLDCELMPWSAKAQELLRSQYAAVGSAGTAALADAELVLSQAAARLPETADLLDRYRHRRIALGQYVAAYRHYCWPVRELDDFRLAPFHLLASEGHVHAGRDHLWHMNTLARLCRHDERLLLATPYRVVDLTDAASQAEGIAWWSELTASGGEGMVVKPLEFVTKGKRGLVQPALKCRGREYLRIIYGPEYASPEHLERLRHRGLAVKRSLALREFALGIEALERFVRHEPLRRVHECVFGVLALESEPVDPRL